MVLLVELLHIVPLLLIAGVLGLPKLYNVIAKKNISIVNINSILLFLCSIGIAAGANAHHMHNLLYIIDPCFGYAVTIIGVAIKIAFNNRVKNKA